MVEVLAEMCGSCMGGGAQRGWRILELHCGAQVLLTSTHQPQHLVLYKLAFLLPLDVVGHNQQRLSEHIRRLLFSKSGGC